MQPGEPGSDAGLTVSEILDAYYKEHAEVNAADPRRQRDSIRHLKEHIGYMLVRDVDIPTCRQYRKLRHPAKPSTIRRELNVLPAAANHAVKWKRMSATDLPQIELPEIPESEDTRWFTKDQIEAMFKARPSGHFACFLRIAYYTASRRRAVQSLTKPQIDLQNRAIRLSRPGQKKTKKRRPTVPLYPEIRPAIDWLLASSGQSPHLFGRARDFYRPFAELMEELGYEGHPHMLRHSRATHMLMDGEDIYKVSRLLGDSVATVEKNYAHCNLDYLSTDSGVAGGELTEHKPKPVSSWFKPLDEYSEGKAASPES